jgi:hypothetical protein
LAILGPNSQIQKLELRSSFSETKELKVKDHLIKLLKNEIVQANLVLISLLVVFFSTPLIHFGDSYYSAVDITQAYSLTNVAPPPGFEIKNPILSDTTFDFNSYNVLNRLSLWSGQFPLWNPYNGGGVPQLGNYQSAFFSIFTIPYYFLPFKLGLLLTAFMKLFGLGFFTFLFLKQLKLHQLAALIGAAGFMFGGYHIIWLQYTVTGVVITLPAGLYFAERIFRNLEPEQSEIPHQNIGPLIGLSFSLLVGLLAAHPETFFFILIGLVLYILFRFFNLAHRHHYQRAKLIALLKVAGQMMAAGLLALGLAAIQLLPFVEYLQNSMAITERANSNMAFFPANLWGLFFFPDTLGNVTTSYGNTFINYNELNGQYIGILMLLLALFSLLFISRDKYIRFFAGLAVGWLFYSYNLLDIQGLINLIPGMRFSFVMRSQSLWLFSISCCAALFVHYQLNSTVLDKLKWSQVRSRNLLLAIVGAAFLVSGIYATKDMVISEYQLLQPYRQAFLSYVPAHIWYLGLTFTVGLVAVIGLGLFHRFFIRLLCGSLLLFMIFLQSGGLLKDFNPTVENRYFYPNTPALDRLREEVGTRTVMQIGWNSIPVNMNMIYKFSEIPNYDSLWINYYELLAREMFGTGEKDPMVSTIRSSEKGLKLFGVEYFMPIKEPFSADLGMADIQFVANTRLPVGEILPDQPVSQTFQAQSPDLRQILLSVYTYGRVNTCNLNVRLEELATAKLVAQRIYNCSDLKDNSPLDFSFAALADSRDRKYRLILNSSDSKPGQAVSVIFKPELNYPAGQLTVRGQVEKGGLDFDFFEGVPANFMAKGKADYRQVYAYKNSLGRYYTVSHADLAPTDEIARQSLDALSFDPYQSVILDLPASAAKSLPDSTETAASAQIISEEAQVIQLKTTRNQPGFLVLTKPFYPGWHVEVDGQEEPLWRANYAFNAVQVPAGISNIKFYYDPISFKLGAVISFISLLVGLVSIIFSNYVFRRKAFNKGVNGK